MYYGGLWKAYYAATFPGVLGYYAGKTLVKDREQKEFILDLFVFSFTWARVYIGYDVGCGD